MKISPLSIASRISAAAEQILPGEVKWVPLPPREQALWGTAVIGEHGVGCDMELLRRALEASKHPAAKRGFVLLPRLWVVKRSFAWVAHLRRLACDYERPGSTLAGLYLLAFLMLIFCNLAETLGQR